MIKLSQLKENQGRVVRETTAPFVTIDDDGAAEPAGDIHFEYYSFSTTEAKKYQDSIAKATYLSEILSPLLVAFIGEDDEGNQVRVPATIEMIEGMNAINLHAILKAIREDASPKTKGEKSPAGSSRAAKKAA